MSRITFYLCFIPLAIILMVGCAQQQMQKQVMQSRVVVLDIGHYYGPGGKGQGARTPDDRYGRVEELTYWYNNVAHVKREIVAAGYQCAIVNRGATPGDAKLAAAGRAAGVIQLTTPNVSGVYRSKPHSNRMAVGMKSVDFALDCKPAAVVFLHHNSNSAHWRDDANAIAMYTNARGTKMAQTMARTLNQNITNRTLPNNGVPCGVIIRNDGRKGGGDWLNACEDSYVPAIITEGTFLNNPAHARYLSNPTNAAHYAQTIGRGIVNYLRSR